MNTIYTKGYFRASWKFQTEPKRLNRLADAVQTLNPINVLDVGCGRGYLMRELRKRNIEVLGVDFSTAAIVLGKRMGIILADAKKLPFDDKSFDLIISTDFFEHIPEHEVDLVYNEMKRVGDRVAAEIAFAEENPKINDFHVTVKPKIWWKEHLPNLIFLDEIGK